MARRQHGVIARRQLIELGFSPKAIKHRAAVGRLYPIWRGVYAVGRAELTQHGRWMAAVLACGPGAVLSHLSAAALWGIWTVRSKMPIQVSVPASAYRRRPGIVVHRRACLATDAHRLHCQIPTTSPLQTLVDIAPTLTQTDLEAAINAADKLDRIDPEILRKGLDNMPRTPGIAKLRRVLDRHTFTLTDSELERRFLALVRRAGLPDPLTQQHVSGFKVDFFWPELKLVVETDGLRYHRTPAEQARDRLRDQAHTAAGLTPLRFPHGQVRYEPEGVVATLTAIVARSAG